MKRKFLSLLILSAICSEPILCSGIPPQTDGVTAAPITVVEWATLNDDESGRIAPELERIWNLAAFYNFAFTEEELFFLPTLLRCPLWTKHVVLRFDSIRGSSFVAVLGPNGILELLPLFYQGIADFDAPFDPHNIAIFNRTIVDESPDLGQEAIWLQEALCYLGVVIPEPKLVLPENIRDLMRDPSDEMIQRLSPVVETSETTVRVSLYEVSADPQLILEWTLTFDRNGLLKAVDQERQRRSDLLPIAQVGRRLPDLPQRPLLVSADLPLYPTLAFLGRLQGTVIVEGTVASGAIVETRIRANEDLAFLARAAAENLRTWHFDTGIDLEGSTITVTYNYIIAGEETLYPESPSVEVDLENWTVTVRGRPFKRRRPTY